MRFLLTSRVLDGLIKYKFPFRRLHVDVRSSPIEKYPIRSLSHPWQSAVLSMRILTVISQQLVKDECTLTPYPGYAKGDAVATQICRSICQARMRTSH
jgi:hypothetical protein